ncbi:MAG TPA: DUF4398 domain-containing protein [Burkholderiaceae bacterium]|nr:DUF4398 domain-containing protein [Burkholderiaceae bacterium]
MKDDSKSLFVWQSPASMRRRDAPTADPGQACEQQLARAKASLEAACRAGGVEFAPLEVNHAEMKLAGARRLATMGELARARRLADEAEVDAQVARSKAAAERSRRAVAEAEAGLDAMAEELHRIELGMDRRAARTTLR